MNSPTKFLIKQKTTFRNLLPMLLLVMVSATAFASTTWYVDGLHGNDSNNCKSPLTACKTIQHAIALALSGDSITVAAATYSENLTIRKSLKIIGSAASTTILDGGGAGTVVSIPNTSTSVSLARMTIRNGRAQDGAGVYNLGTLTIASTTISGNTWLGSYRGGGIYNGGTLTIYNSTVSDNLASGQCFFIIRPFPHFICFGGLGAGIYSDGTLSINNSTVSGNMARCGTYPSKCIAPSAGGGIYSSPGTLTINNSTISGNGANIGGGISDQATLQNSIVAYNSGNCSGTMTSHGYNLSSDSTCNFSNSGDRNNIDPKLGTLGNHGGPTPTIPLLSGSPAIDAGNPSGCTDGAGHLLKTDQRGLPRPNTEDIKDQKGCDMGAYETQSD